MRTEKNTCGDRCKQRWRWNRDGDGNGDGMEMGDGDGMEIWEEAKKRRCGPKRNVGMGAGRRMNGSRTQDGNTD